MRSGALARLLLFPGVELLGGRPHFRVPEDVRMPTHELVADGAHDAFEVEVPGLLGHLRMEDHLQQQVAEFVAQRLEVAAPDRVIDLVGFFDRVRGDRRKGLLDIPRTAALRVAQLRHDPDQPFDRAHVPDSPYTRLRSISSLG